VANVRYFAGARVAAGVAEESIPAATLADLVHTVAARSDRMAAVLAASSFLIDGLAAHDRTLSLPRDATVDVLPPFAGG
jgi:sulfur-carrier protein